MGQDLTQEKARSFVLGLGKKKFGGLVFEDPAFVHEDDPCRDPMGKTHLMGDHDHGHAFAGQVRHHIEDLVDHLRVQGGGGFVKEHDLGLHGQGPGNGHPLLLAARELAG